MVDRHDITAGNRVIRAADLVAQPWANRGGLTRVIAEQPDFRLSLATIAEDGPFSHFPGMVRYLAVIAGRLVLHPFAGVRDAAAPALVFDGADAVAAQVLDGPVLALNLMVPAGSPLRLERGEGRQVAGARAVFAAAAMVIADQALAAHDTLIPTGALVVPAGAWVVR